MHSPLEISLRDVINSASTMTHTLSGEFADSQRQLHDRVVSGENSQSTNSLNHMINGSLLHEKIETPPVTTQIRVATGTHTYPPM